MLAKLLDLKRLLLISPELVCILAVGLLLQRNPDLLANIASSVWNAKGLPGFLGGLPAALVGVSYKLGMSVLRPGDEEENKILYEWPLYWALECRVYVSIIICAVATGVMALFYLNPFEWTPATSGAIFIGAMLVPVMTVIPLVVAKMAIRKILTLYR